MIPFQILGGEAQVVQIKLKPQEFVIIRPGAMCFMSGSVEMVNIFMPENEVGMWHWLFGKTITSVVIRNTGSSDGFVGIAAPSLARILPIDLAMFGGEILCQPDAFLCSINDVNVNVAVDPRARNVMGSAEGFLRQKLTGQGLAFIIAGGSVVQKKLDVGEVLTVDVSCIAAVNSTVSVQIKYNGPLRRAVFGVSISLSLSFLTASVTNLSGGFGIAGRQYGNSYPNGTRDRVHPEFALSTFFPTHCKVNILLLA
ncbi:unnamed protein product [Linum tenue]|uniref:Altered inheritance of mitochondria protein 24, mitochondrial n=1 Tax=Linum tenue TaxID=586396 RepID=A0AAV0JVC6_9ROSI|nr:unnamed protein product [Linum tenue]